MKIRFGLLACAALLLLGCTSPVEQAGGDVPFAYQEQTVSTFMADCMAELNVEQCLCVLDRFRVDSSESAYLELRNGNRYRKVFGDHAMACGAPRAAVAAKLPSSLPATIPVTPGIPAAVGSSTAAPPSVPTERKVTNAEACLQERLAAAAAKAPDSAVPLDEFERIRNACGM